MAWRVLTGRNKSITVSFLPAGHTKFSPDWCFGLFKQKFRRSEVGCLQDIAKVVEASSYVNKAQIVTAHGDNPVKTYDWTGYFIPYFKRIPNITTYHHFHFDSNSPGKISLRETADGQVTALSHLKDEDDSTFRSMGGTSESNFPNQVPPKGLTAERQWYLYDKIRQFCPDASKDLTCPLPSVPRPTSSARNTPEPVEMEIDPPSKERRCGKCGKTGHNRRSCH